MLSKKEYIRYSLEYNLFFGRLMKEHLMFLESGFSIKDSKYILEADTLKSDFEDFLLDVISIVNGHINKEVLTSKELVTPYTLEAENITQNYTGICINTHITQMEMNLLKNKNLDFYDGTFPEVQRINSNAMNLVNRTIDYKSKVLANVLTCRVLNRNYPTLLEHVLEEAEFYRRILNALESFDEIPIKNELVEKEVFWNHIMEEHSLFIRGLLDPEEERLIKIAHKFAQEFEKLAKEAEEVLNKNLPYERITKRSKEATKDIITFKESGTVGLINCEIKSIILPLLADHLLREAYHYLRVLKTKKPGPKI